MPLMGSLQGYMCWHGFWVRRLPSPALADVALRCWQNLLAVGVGGVIVAGKAELTERLGPLGPHGRTWPGH